MSSSEQEIYDVICVGFGPASLAVAVALEDWTESRSQVDHTTQPDHIKPKVKFLERQSSFKWHAGMLIPSAKMQISFIKDLATARDPLSRFTFLNYLKEHGRLAHFARLNTFLPSRAEFADYLRWAAGFFEDLVRYDHDVVRVRPVRRDGEVKVSCFEVEARNRSTREVVTLLARHVVIGIGGSPSIPALLRPHIYDPYQTQRPPQIPWSIHSSQYMTTVPTLFPSCPPSSPNPSTPLPPPHIAILGSGQSAAEIFDDLSHRLPHALTTLIFRDSALRPSDDSPFVNEVFDPAAIDPFFNQSASTRRANVYRDKATNYGVVRLELIEKIYRDLCVQDLEMPDRTKQRRRIMPCTEIDGVQVLDQGAEAGAGRAILSLRTVGTTSTHSLPIDLIVLATGYTRKAHLDMLASCRALNLNTSSASNMTATTSESPWTVQRDYSLALNRNLVDDDVGIWLQGCNEETHGLSDSLLSVLATRSGGLVRSIFGRDGELSNRVKDGILKKDGGRRPSGAEGILRASL